LARGFDRRFASASLRLTAVLLQAVALAGCGGHSPGGPTPPSIENITLTCPSDVQIDNVSGSSQNVTYTAPAATGGVPPLTVTCNPASGSSFPIGSTPVACSATDSVRFAACSFKVTLVAKIPVLAVTRFLAFGDSITAGENGTVLNVPVPQFVDLANSYPVVLKSMLEERYTTQSFTVVMSGVPSETAVEGAARIAGALDAARPDALLLLEGVNDCVNHQPCIPSVIADALRQDIVQARARNVTPFVSTLLPVDGTGSRGSTYQWPLIPSVNDAIRLMVAGEGAILVDNWAAFQGHDKAGDYLASDGLHPSPAGNRAMAQAFLDAIRTKFEQTAASSAATRRVAAHR